MKKKVELYKCIKKLTHEDQRIGQIQFLRTLLQSGY